MSESGARSAIVLSAFIVAGVYAWRWLAGGPRDSQLSLASLTAMGEPLVSPEGFLVAWGFTYLTLSLLSTFAAGFAGGMALLILLTDLIANFASASETALALQRSKTQQKGQAHVQKRA